MSTKLEMPNANTNQDFIWKWKRLHARKSQNDGSLLVSVFPNLSINTDMIWDTFSFLAFKDKKSVTHS